MARDLVTPLICSFYFSFFVCYLFSCFLMLSILYINIISCFLDIYVGYWKKYWAVIRPEILWAFVRLSMIVLWTGVLWQRMLVSLSCLICHLSLLQRIFGDTAEKNLYLSQLIIMDTLEKCLAGVRDGCRPFIVSHLHELSPLCHLLLFQHHFEVLRGTSRCW